MIYRLEIIKDAMLDIEETFLWYEVISPSLRDRFEIQLYISLEEIIANPIAWHLLNKKARCKKLKRFPYLVIFVIKKDLISIVAVIHESRHPKNWKRRIRGK